MKKAIILLSMMIGLIACVPAQSIKVQALPTTSTGGLYDYLIKDRTGGGAGATQIMTVGNFMQQYFGGTIGYFPYWNTTNTFSVSPIYTNGQFVGIGTTNPLAALHVYNGSGTSAILLDAPNTQTKLLGFRVNGSSRWKIRVDGTEAGANAGSDFYFERLSDAGSLIDAPFFIKRSTGYLGLGNPTPTQQLDIIGSIKMVDGNEGLGKVLTSDANGVASWNNSVELNLTVASNFSVVPVSDTHDSITGLNSYTLQPGDYIIQAGFIASTTYTIGIGGGINSESPSNISQSFFQQSIYDSGAKTLLTTENSVLGGATIYNFASTSSFVLFFQIQGSITVTSPCTIYVFAYRRSAASGGCFVGHNSYLKISKQ